MMRRSRPTKKPLSKILIVCEGENPEEQYFNGVRRDRRVPKERLLIYPSAGVPKTVAETAVQIKNQNDSRNRLDGLDVNDQVWIVFDRDEHPEIQQAKDIARANGISVAFSNPCIEVFILLHFQELNRGEHRDVVARLVKKYIPSYDKHIDYDGLDLKTKYDEAKLRIERINDRSEVIAGIENPPYCSVCALIDELKKM